MAQRSLHSVPHGYHSCSRWAMETMTRLRTPTWHQFRAHWEVHPAMPTNNTTSDSTTTKTSPTTTDTHPLSPKSLDPKSSAAANAEVAAVTASAPTSYRTWRSSKVGDHYSAARTQAVHLHDKHQMLLIFLTKLDITSKRLLTSVALLNWTVAPTELLL